MNKFFNTAGPCRLEWHYVVDPLPRLQGVEALIESKQYFILHAPRQTGKTTYLYALMRHLNATGRYTTLQINIQAAASGRDELDAMRIVSAAIYQQALLFLPEVEWPEKVAGDKDWLIKHPNGLQQYLANWASHCPKPVILLIDEADSLLDDFFLALLRQLRAGFEARPHAFPQSIALVGLRDIRDYKIRISSKSTRLGSSSPFNIKSKSLFMPGFSQPELYALLDQHTQETEQVFSSEVKQEIWHLTQGQPWLCNALANQIIDEILDNDTRQTICLKHVTQACEDLIQRRDTHLDSLVDKLNEAPVKRIAEAIINGSELIFDKLNDDLSYVRDLGLITLKPPVRFANPIYQEIIPRILSLAFEESLPGTYVENRNAYINQGQLNMTALLKAFQKFYRRHSEAWLNKYDFREVGKQLLLMAFLQRIINSGGQIEREMAVGNGRCDLFISYGGEQHIIELKLYRDQFTREEGLKQIETYMDKLGLNVGWLLIFETRANKTWKQRLSWEKLAINGKIVQLLGM